MLSRSLRCHQQSLGSTLLRAAFTTKTADGQEKLFDKILIANRGEIAIRVMESCRKLGIKTVAVHSEADANAKFVRFADEAVCVGPAPSAQSYLDIDAIVGAVKQTGAQAVHPGYGFLSENTNFCARLEEEGVRFIGPASHAIKIMGDKILSKELALEAKVNVIGGDSTELRDEAHCVEKSQAIGYPVMVKATAGGGGKGMRVARNDQEAADAFRLCTAEATAAFGDGRMFVEKFIEDPRHIEIQVLCDTHGNAVYLNERECSLQRRNQKVLEEAPSLAVTPELRKQMGEQAVRLARAVDYQSAGTVECLLDKHGKFYFLEMNTRLQVEHPVTEFITGVDLVEQMIRVAAGKELSVKQEDIGINGWAIEARVYSEDPYRKFLPSIGTLTQYVEPKGPAYIRCDSGIEEGSEISVHYDPMISKLICWGEDRDTALQRLRDSLDSYVINGVQANVPFLRCLTDHPKFITGDVTTTTIDEEFPDGYHGHELTEQQHEALLAQAALVHNIRNLRQQTLSSGRLSSADSRYHGRLFVTVGSGDDAKTFELELDQFDGESALISIDGQSPIRVATDYVPGAIVAHTDVDDERFITQVAPGNDNTSFSYSIQLGGMKHSVVVHTPNEHALNQHMPEPVVIDQSKMLLSPMPGNLYSIGVQPGDKVVAGQEICIVEAMKMQNVLSAAADGIVKAVHFSAGDTLQADDVILELETDETEQAADETEQAAEQ